MTWLIHIIHTWHDSVVTITRTGVYIYGWMSLMKFNRYDMTHSYHPHVTWFICDDHKDRCLHLGMSRMILSICDMTHLFHPHVTWLICDDHKEKLCHLCMSLIVTRLWDPESCPCILCACLFSVLHIETFTANWDVRWQRSSSCVFAWDLHINNRAVPVEFDRNNRAILVHVALFLNSQPNDQNQSIYVVHVW